jgi:hypothetical protein
VGGSNGATLPTVEAYQPATGGVVFQSDWETATGTDSNAVMDGRRWDNWWEFNNGTSVQLLSVVSGASINGPGRRNALKVLQRGPMFAANLQQNSVVPPSTDFYVRFYMRNDDTSRAGDHVATVDTWGYANLTYVKKFSSPNGWQFVLTVDGCEQVYPLVHWGPWQHRSSPPANLLSGQWYRLEYYVHYTDATHIQVHPRVYNASGALLFDDASFLQQDYPDAPGWTLASYYAAGHAFCVNPGPIPENPAPMRSFGLGNNGQQGAGDTGLAWYFAGVQIRTDTWPGP